MTDETATGMALRAIRNEIIEQCAKVADGARESAKEAYGIEASIGADIAARRIRALVGQQPERGK